MRIDKLFSALFGPAALPAITQAEPATAGAPAAVVAGVGDVSRVIRIAAGQTLAIEVHDNASIGYVWHVAKVPRNLRSDGFLFEGPPSRALGAGSSKHFRFTALRRGRAPVRLIRFLRGKPESRLKFDILVD